MTNNKILDFLNQYEKKDSVYILNNNAKNQFQSIYTEVRKKEGLFYDENILSYLPLTDKFYPNSSLPNQNQNYWKIRKRSALKLIKYLNKNRDKQNQTIILDLGTGNGWMANLLSKINNSIIIGLDINLIELKLAANIFRKDNLYFVLGDIMQDLFEDQIFDYIILSSSIQYFQNVDELINKLFTYLKDSGEIHIIDSKLYNDDELENAKIRSIEYYKNINQTQMIEFYHHINYKALSKFNMKILRKEDNLNERILQRFGRLNSPFPWVVLHK